MMILAVVTATRVLHRSAAKAATPYCQLTPCHAAHWGNHMEAFFMVEGYFFSIEWNFHSDTWYWARAMNPQNQIIMHEHDIYTSLTFPNGTIRWGQATWVDDYNGYGRVTRLGAGPDYSPGDLYSRNFVSFAQYPWTLMTPKEYASAGIYVSGAAMSFNHTRSECKLLKVTGAVSC